MSIKLIAVDIDGTLCRDDKSYDEEGLKKVLKIMKERNMYFVIATGNQYELVQKRFHAIKDDIVSICENGTKIVYHDEVLSTNTLANASKKEILDLLYQYPVMIVMCGKKHAYIEKQYQNKDPFMKQFYDNIVYVDNLKEVEDDVLKYSIAEFSGKSKEIMQDLLTKLPEEVTALTTGFEWFDIFNKTINKGIAITFLQDYFHLTKEECAAFGDQMNDYALLEAVGQSYAMKNAVPSLKEVARYITEKDNNEDGVIDTINKLL